MQTGLHEAFPYVEPVVPAPRVGIAWNVTKSTVVRGGFGIFSDLYQGLIADRLITNFPGVASFTAEFRYSRVGQSQQRLRRGAEFVQRPAGRFRQRRNTWRN